MGELEWAAEENTVSSGNYQVIEIVGKMVVRLYIPKY